MLPRVAGRPVPSGKSGYIQAVDAHGLLKLMVRHDPRMKMERRIGQFVSEGGLLATVMADGGVDEEVLRRVQDLYTIGKQRTLQEDAEFGVQQLVDVALKALSPGINDLTTVANCLDHRARSCTAWLVARYHPTIATTTRDACELLLAR